MIRPPSPWKGLWACTQTYKDFNAPSTVFWQANTNDARGQVLDETLGNGVRTVRTIMPQGTPGAHADVDIGSVISGSATLLSVPAGVAEMSGMTRLGSNGRLYFQTPRGRIFRGNQYVSTASLARVGKLAGAGAVMVTAAVDVHSLSTGKIDWRKFSTDGSVIGVSLLVGGPFGLGLSATYFGADSWLQLRDQDRSVMAEWCAQHGNSC